MDISEVKPSERMIDIVHPKTNELLGIKVSLVSLNDPKMKGVRRKIQDEKNRLEARGKYFKSDDIEENIHAVLFGSMTGWEWGGDANFKGEKPAFTRANVQAVFTELPWFMQQIDEAIGDEKAFF